ncbi:hypothetical protein H0H92_003632 [Tricholoma furcatifolium]|nr:hypothetical protein H0H92_003632 [Tricholoma furcatifolium]
MPGTTISSHDTNTPPPTSPRRRHRSPSTKRSPSPIISFSPTPLSGEKKGVKNITRKVIKTLEGLGHLDTSELDMDIVEECDTDSENVPNGNGAIAHAKTPTQTPTQNGSANGGVVPPPRKKIDWEIPRKVLHSSIGFGTLYLYLGTGDVRTVTLALWTALALIVPADLLRLRYPPFERLFERCLGFLMRESEKVFEQPIKRRNSILILTATRQKSTNGVIWYILGVNFALTFYPLDVATVAILILSWADTTASTFGRLYGPYTPPLPRRTPVLRLPLAPRKSLAGFVAATLTGALVAVGFWALVAPVRPEGLSWTWDGGVGGGEGCASALSLKGAWGLGVVGVVAGLVSGVAEALDLGSLDDNLTLPVIAGGCLLGFFKLLGMVCAPAAAAAAAS